MTAAHKLPDNHLAKTLPIIEENDEASAIAEAAALLSEHGYTVRAPRKVPLAGDADLVSVWVEIANARGTVTVSCPCTLAVVNDQVVDVIFGDGWARLLAAVDLDPYDSDSEGWLASEAKRVFQRGGGR